jgi:MFS superfamily sulfate permease-like transporter
MSPQQRMRATLAFAWNPLLLFEACVNAHVDATLLFLVLLAIWFLIRRTPLNIYSFLLAAAMFAVATCVNFSFSAGSDP